MPLKNIFSDDGAVKYVYMNSLKNMAMTKVVTSLWANGNIQNQIIEFSPNIAFTKMSRACWKEVQKNVFHKLSELHLAKPLKNMLMNIIPSVGDNIYQWIIYYENCLFKNVTPLGNSASSFINDIDWNITSGKIDYAKSARNILSNNCTSLNEDQKYKLACDCCLEDQISIIAPKVLQPHYLNSVSIDEYPMVHYWTAKITGDYTTIHHSIDSLQLNKEVSHCGVIIEKLLTDNPIANEYYNGVPLLHIWKSLSDAEKFESIESIMDSLHSPELKLRLLSTLNCEQQRFVFETFPQGLISSCLDDWQWREYFLPLSHYVIDTILPECYFFALYDVLLYLHKISPEENRYMYDEYKSIFMTLWLNAPNEHKVYFLDFYSYMGKTVNSLIYTLNDIRDIDIMKLILKDMHAQKKKCSPLTDLALLYCAFLVLNWQWEMLELFIIFTLFPQKYYLNHLNQNNVKEREHRARDQKCEKFHEGFFTAVICNSEFRENSNYIRCLHIFRWITLKVKADYFMLNDNYKWCFEEELYEMGNISVYFPEFFHWLLIIFKLVEEDIFELLYENINMGFTHKRKRTCSGRTKK